MTMGRLPLVAVRIWLVGVGGVLLVAGCAEQPVHPASPPVASEKSVHPASPPTASVGIVTGRAWPCDGPPAPGLKAKVQVYLNRRVVGSQQVVSGGTYRFALPPGRYVVTNTGNLTSGLPNWSVTVAAGQATHLDVPDRCM